MSSFSTLPLGVDIGATRVRIACAEADRAGRIRVRAVVGRDYPAHAVSPVTSGVEPSLVAALIEEVRSDIGVRERRAVASLGGAVAALRVLPLPDMTWVERTRVARFEAQRCILELSEPDDTEECVVRVHPADARGRWTIGATRATALAQRVAILRAARLRVVAIDLDALALRRAIAQGDAIADIGLERSTLYAFGDCGPLAWSLSCGGAEITRTIASDLAIDYATAEKRKRILGVSGAGMAGRARLVHGLASLIETARLRTPIARLALTGNGVRLVGLAQRLEEACGAAVEMPAADLLHTASYPPDVIRAAAPDWSLAVGLALWNLAA